MGFNAAKVMEMVVLQGGTQKHAKLLSDHRHPNTITRFLQAVCHSCTNSVKALKVKFVVLTVSQIIGSKCLQLGQVNMCL